MSKSFYPIIDYDKCIECGLCINECEFGVYDENESFKPVVLNPDSCRLGCAKCAPDCPTEAITYSSNENIKSDGCGCGDGGCGDDCDCDGDCGDDCNCGCESE